MIADELQLLGSHGLAAHEYPGMLDFVTHSDIDLTALVSRRISLDEAPEALAGMDTPAPGQAGVTVIVPSER